jgi:hypothetical protein
MESLRLLVDLVRAPTSYYHHFQRFPASLLFKLTFGQPLNDDGKDLATAIEIFTGFAKDITPNAHLVDSFPVLDLLPDFLSPCASPHLEPHRPNLTRNPNQLACRSESEAPTGTRGDPDLSVTNWEHRLIYCCCPQLYGKLSLEVKARMQSNIEMECFTARLWEQQEKLNIPDEELFYSTVSCCAHRVLHSSYPTVAGSAFITGYIFSASPAQYVQYFSICRDGHQLSNTALVCDGHGALS